MPDYQPEYTIPKTNAALASLFHQMSLCYRYAGGEERFRANAYEKVSKLLYTIKEDIANYGDDLNSLDNLEGVGESIGKKIIEYIHTGKIRAFELIKNKIPFELLELMDIIGFGPSTLKALHVKLGINSREGLLRALESGKLEGLRGFGKKRIENMKRYLKLYKKSCRMLRKEAEIIGLEMLRELKKIPGVQKVKLAGSLRRRERTIGDIDLVIQSKPLYRTEIVKGIIALPSVEKVLAKGITKVSLLLKYHHVQVDIRLVNDHEFGAAMLYFTGSREHVIRLRKIAKAKGFKINEYGIFDAVSGKQLAGSTEEGMYHFMNLEYIPPELRVGQNEIEKAVMKIRPNPVKSN